MLWYNKAHWDASTVEKAINFIDPPNFVQADEDEDDAQQTSSAKKFELFDYVFSK